MDRVEHGWIGIEAGKGHHHVVLIDQEGRTLLSSRVANDEPDLIALVQKIRDHIRHPRGGIDVVDGGGALMVALLLRSDQAVFYIPGIAVNRASAGYRGQGKTDAKDAAIIADQARMRRDLRRLQLLDDNVAQLQLMTAYRADLAADRIRSINRLRGLLVGAFPALERVLDFTNRTADLDQRFPDAYRDPAAGPCAAGSLAGKAWSSWRGSARPSGRGGGQPTDRRDLRHSGCCLIDRPTRSGGARARPPA